MGSITLQLRVHYLALFLGCVLSCLSFDAAAAQSESMLLQELKDNYALLQDARAVFAEALRGGRLSAREKNEYGSWIQQLGQRVQQNCIDLADVKVSPLPSDPPCEQFLSGLARPARLDLATETSREEKTGQLLEQMNHSLGEFDERLLREQDRVRAQRPRNNAEASTTAGGMAGTGSDGQNPTEAETGQAGQTDATADRSQGPQNTADGGDARTASGQAGQGGSTSPRGAPGRATTGKGAEIPEDIPDGSDDDIVARQLREAAEKEQDPELREKLWDEYRRYKAGTG